MPNKEFSNFNSNDVSRFPIVSIQVKFHSCPVWSSVIWLYAWMDSSLMKCGTELAKVFTIFNKGRISCCAQIFFYGWNSNRVLFEVFSTAKSNSVLFWTPGNSLTTHTQWITYKVLNNNLICIPLLHDLIKIRLNIPCGGLKCWA